MAMIEAALTALRLFIVLLLFSRLGRIHEFRIDDFAGVDDRLTALGAGAALVGDAGIAVGAVHVLSLLRVKRTRF